MGFWSSLGAIGGAAVGSLFGPAGTAIGGSMGSAIGGNVDSNRAWNKQKDLSWEMWNAENEYNHPVKQMERLREANLNPNLVYGSGATTLSASTKGVPQYQIPNTQMDALNMVNAYQDIRQKDAMTENIKAQAMKSAADALVAIKDYDTYSKTGAHPNRGLVNQFTNIIMDGFQRYAEPVTNWVGDRITDFNRPVDLKYDFFGQPLKK